MSLVNTLVQPLRTSANPEFYSNDYRRSMYGITEMARNNVSYILNQAQLDNIARSIGNSVQIPVLTADASSTIGNTVTCVLALGDDTSNLVTLTFTTYSFGFTMNRANFFNNQFDYETVFQKKLIERLQKFAAALDTAGYNVLNTNKNKVWNADTLATYAQTANALQVPLAAQNDFYNNIAAIMNSMDYYGTFDVAASTFHKPAVSRFINQGGGNATNLAFQFPGFEFAYSNRIPNATGVKSTGFVMKPDSFGMFNRNYADPILGSKTATTEWGITPNVPIVGIDMGYIYSSFCADGSTAYAATNPQNTATAVESFQWYTQVGWIVPYTADSTTNNFPIVKFEFLNA